MNIQQIKTILSKTKHTPKLLACPKCKHADSFRVNVMQDVDVTLNEYGEYEIGFSFSDPDIDTDSGEVDCIECGVKLLLRQNAGKYYLVIDATI